MKKFMLYMGINQNTELVTKLITPEGKRVYIDAIKIGISGLIDHVVYRDGICVNMIKMERVEVRPYE